MTDLLVTANPTESPGVCETFLAPGALPAALFLGIVDILAYLVDSQKGIYGYDAWLDVLVNKVSRVESTCILIPLDVDCCLLLLAGPSFNLIHTLVKCNLYSQACVSSQHGPREQLEGY